MNLDWRRIASIALGVVAGMIATGGTLAVAVAGFTLSYDAIRKVGVAAGVRVDWAWLLPVSIDGAMAVATVTAVVMSRMGRRNWYPWAVVIVGASISIACNAVHAQMRDAIQLGDETAMAVSAIPAVMLALSVHLLVVLIDAAARALSGEDETRDSVTEPVEIPAVTPAALGVPEPIVAAPRRTAGRPSGAAKVARVAARMPDATPDKIAAKTGLSPRTVRRHLAAMDVDTAPVTRPVNGSEPDLSPAAAAAP